MKRGISQLISAVLLIVLVVALISVLINFSRKSVEGSLEEGQKALEGFSSCEEVKFFVEGAECKDDLLIVKIKNEKNINFQDGFALRSFYEDGNVEEVGSFLYNTKLLAYEVGDIVAARKESGKGVFGQSLYNSIDFIEIIPKVEAGSSFKFCNDKKVKIEVKETC